MRDLGMSSGRDFEGQLCWVSRFVHVCCGWPDKPWTVMMSTKAAPSSPFGYKTVSPADAAGCVSNVGTDTSDLELFAYLMLNFIMAMRCNVLLRRQNADPSQQVQFRKSSEVASRRTAGCEESASTLCM